MRRATDIPDGLGVDELMRIAVDLTGDTYPHPNPRVGCIITSSDGSVLGTGVCEGDGLAHAEANALSSLSDPVDAHGATAYVTLEPCSHFGRTPPCADALIAAGVSRVVIGSLDPDPRVRGRGIQKLRDAGVDVVTDVCMHEVEAADPGYFHHRRTGRPLVTLKMASTLDGQAGALDGTSQWITSEEARTDAHRLRSEHDAVLVGAGTAIADDPRLSVRVEGYSGPQPRPVVLAGSRPLPTGLNVLASDALVIQPDVAHRVDIDSALKKMGEEQLLSVLVEGGPTVAQAFLAADRVDRMVWYVGGKIAGGVGQPSIAGSFATLTDAVDLNIERIAMLGNTVRVDAKPRRAVS